MAYTGHEPQASNLRGGRRKGKEEETEPKQLEDASSQLNKDDGDEFHLAFQQTELPEILADLPFELPSLPGIADEFNFEDSLGEAFNNFGLSGSMVLPDLAHLSTGLKTAPTAQPTLPTFELPSLPTVEASANILPPPLVPLPPPPPPPPPPLLPPVLSEDKRNSSTTVSQPPKPPSSSIPPSVSADGGRASLLESIRAAAGRPRSNKTVKERKHDQKLKKREEEEEAGIQTKTSKSEPMDMMSELRKRLESRRSGISSDKKPTSSTTFSTKEDNRKEINFPHDAIRSMSALIPPPPPQEDDQSDSSGQDFNDEDWD